MNAYLCARYSDKRGIYGKTHISVDEDYTLCGKEINQHWYYLGEEEELPNVKITCKECLEIFEKSKGLK